MVLESLRQPVINGYLIAGSIVGPGGLQLVKVPLLPTRHHHLCCCNTRGLAMCRHAGTAAGCHIDDVSAEPVFVGDARGARAADHSVAVPIGHVLVTSIWGLPEEAPQRLPAVLPQSLAQAESLAQMRVQLLLLFTLDPGRGSEVSSKP